MKYKYLLFLLSWLSLPAYADYTINPDDRLKVSIGGYARFFTGKVESHQYNNAMKTEPYVKVKFDINDDWSVGGKLAYRVIWDDRYSSSNRHKFYDAYATVESKTFGKIDVGNLKNIGYLLHQGPTDVSILCVEDTDIYLFYPSPKGFYSPILTYMYTDARDTKITYTTPDLNGFKWGITAVQSDDKKYDAIAPGVKIDHGKGVISSAQFIHDFEVLKVGVSAAYAYYHDDRFFYQNTEKDGHHSEISTGINLSKNGYSWGAAYKQIVFEDKLDIDDTYVYSTGIAYEKDPYGVSLGYLYSKTKHIVKNNRHHAMLSGRYKFNQYMHGVLSTGYMEFDTDHGADSNGFFGIASMEFRL